MIRILLTLMILGDSVCAEGINALILRARELKYTILIGTVGSVEKAEPEVIVTVPGQPEPLRSRGFYKVGIQVEEVLYDHEFGLSFKKLPNPQKAFRTVLLSSSSWDAKKWVGPIDGELKIFIIGPSHFDISNIDVCYGTLNISEKEQLKKHLAAAIPDLLKYNEYWSSWNASQNQTRQKK